MNLGSQEYTTGPTFFFHHCPTNILSLPLLNTQEISDEVYTRLLYKLWFDRAAVLGV